MSLTCHANAVCSGAKCACGPNYYGDGFNCERATCTNNVAAGYYFNTTEVILAGENATTTQCPPGSAGYATRLCLWNGANSTTGVWAEPYSNCHPIACPAVDEFNAHFASVYIGSVAGACSTGYAGTISRQCLYNATSGEAYWGAPSDPEACKQIKCDSEEFGFATWPEFVPDGQNAEVAGACLDGFEPTDSGQGGPKRICQASGGYLATITNPCVRKKCPAETYDNAVYSEAPAGTVAAGTCQGLYHQSPQPLRECLLSGQWSDDVTNPCVPITCPALDNFNGNVFGSVPAGSADVEGTCAPGFQLSGVPRPTMSCNEDGTWSGTVANACVQKKCAPTTEGGASWPETAAGNPPTQAVGTCDSFHRAADGVPPYRGCNINGGFEEIKNPCVPVKCAAITTPGSGDGYATWPESSASSELVVGACPAGFSGVATRLCKAVNGVGVWDAVETPCEPSFCEGVDDTNTTGIMALFDDTMVGEYAVGQCADGLFGRPRRLCQSDGTFAPEIINPCAPSPCPALEEDGFASWPETTVEKADVIGTCKPGYRSKSGANPVRMCSLTGSGGNIKGWNPIQAGTECVRSVCQALTDPNQPTFPETPAPTSDVIGTCPAGTSGQPKKNCNDETAWEDNADSVPCTRTLPHYPDSSWARRPD